MAKDEFRFPAMPVYVNDWLASGSIAVMSPLAELAYFRLLLFQWKAPDCLLPSDADEILAALSRANGSWPAIKDSVLVHFEREKKTQKLFNKKLRSFWLKAVENNKAKRRGGINSGKSRRKAVNTLPLLFEQNANSPPNRTRTKLNISSSSSVSEEVKKKTPYSPPNGGRPAQASRKKYPEKGAITDEEIQVAEAVFAAMQQVSGFRFDARFRTGEPTENVKFIAALVRRGEDEVTLRRVAKHTYTAWSEERNGEEKIRNYYRPETVFNLTKYVGYKGKVPLGEAAAVEAPLPAGQEVRP